MESPREESRGGTKMISILLLPFMCLSMAQEGAKAEGKPFSVNEITSSVNHQAKRGERNISLASSVAVHNEGNGYHESYATAEETASIGKTDYDFEIRGKTSKLNKCDIYSIKVADRVRAHFRFAAWGRNMTGSIHDERGKKLFEFTDDDEEYGPTALFKKGIYFVVINTKDEYDTEYVVSMWSNVVDTKETVTIDADMMKKYKALVWESDYVPGGVEPVDGTIVKTEIKPSRSLPWKYTGGFYSCEVNEEFLARSIYIWSNDVFELLKKDIESYREAASAALSKVEKSQRILAGFSTVSTVTGGLSYVCSFSQNPIGAAASVVLGTISFATSIPSMIIGNGTEIDQALLENQCSRIIGAIDSATDGTILSIKENAVIKLYKNDSKYTKRHVYRLKYIPHLAKTNQTSSVVERKADGKYPTYDTRLHHGDEHEITSDCQGTFKTYTSIDDIKFSFNNGD